MTVPLLNFGPIDPIGAFQRGRDDRRNERALDALAGHYGGGSAEPQSNNPISMLVGALTGQPAPARGGSQAPQVASAGQRSSLPPGDVLRTLLQAPATRQFGVSLLKAHQAGEQGPEFAEPFVDDRGNLVQVGRDGRYHILQEADSGPDPTALQRNLSAAGLEPGSPEYQDAILKGTQRGTTIKIDQRAQGEFAKKVGAENAKRFFGRREGALDAAKSLQSTAEAKKLLDSGVITGFGANYAVAFGKALQQVGINLAPDAIANTEAFAASRAQEVGRIIKLFGAGTGLSDADREFATKAAAGQITLTEASIRRILDINERAARNIISRFNRDAQRVPEGVSSFPLTVDLEHPEGGSGGGDVPTVQTPDEARRLPSGTRFRTPDGRIKVVP